MRVMIVKQFTGAPPHLKNLIVNPDEVTDVYLTAAPKASWGFVVVSPEGEHWFPTPTMQKVYTSIEGPSCAERRALEVWMAAINDEIETINQLNAEGNIQAFHSWRNLSDRIITFTVWDRESRHYPDTQPFHQALVVWNNNPTPSNADNGYPGGSKIAPASNPKKKGIFR